MIVEDAFVAKGQGPPIQPMSKESRNKKRKRKDKKRLEQSMQSLKKDKKMRPTDTRKKWPTQTDQKLSNI